MVQQSNLSNVIQSQYTCNLVLYPGNMTPEPVLFIHIKKWLRDKTEHDSPLVTL